MYKRKVIIYLRKGEKLEAIDKEDGIFVFDPIGCVVSLTIWHCGISFQCDLWRIFASQPLNNIYISNYMIHYMTLSHVYTFGVIQTKLENKFSHPHQNNTTKWEFF